MSESNIMGTYKRFDVTFVKGNGCKLYDDKGKEYIDFVSGVAVNCLGHSHPTIVDTICEQSKKLIHISNYYWNEHHTLLANKLCQYNDHDKVFFCNSGTEAVEGALKTARKYGKLHGGNNKNVILYMSNSFHGRSMGALSVTGQGKYQNDFMPLLGAVKEIPFNDVETLNKNFDENVCGVIIEPIQGEGGINSASPEFLKALRDLCDKYDSLLIFDEVQCGMGRLGTLFAYKKFNVIPDVICIAKALGGGFPIGAFITNKKASVLVPGDHGSTYGGNPLGSAVSLAIVNELTDGGIIDSIAEKSAYFINKLEELKEKYNFITEIRGLGLLLGIKIKGNISDFINDCFENGLLLITAGPEVIRLLPPLNVSKEDIDNAVSVMEKVIQYTINK